MTSHSSASLLIVGLLRSRSNELMYVRLDTSENASWLSPRTLRTVFNAVANECFAVTSGFSPKPKMTFDCAL
jgi:hypothetical protein